MALLVADPNQKLAKPVTAKQWTFKDPACGRALWDTDTDTGTKNRLQDTNKRTG